MLRGGMLRIGPRATEFLLNVPRRKPKTSEKFGAGVKSFSGTFFPVHISLWEKDISHLCSRLAEKYNNEINIKNEEDTEANVVNFSELRAEIERISAEQGLGVRLEMMKFLDERGAELPGIKAAERTFPVLVAEGVNLALKPSMTVLRNGEEIITLGIQRKPKEAAILAIEGRAGMVIEESPVASVNLMRTLKGKPNSLGYAIAKVVAVNRTDVSRIEAADIPEEGIEAEKKACNAAIEQAREHIEASRGKLQGAGNKVFEGILMLVPELRTNLLQAISTDKVNTKKAVDVVIGEYAKTFDNMMSNTSAVWQGQAKDLRDNIRYFGESILMYRYNMPDSVITDIEKSSEEVILAAHELSPNNAAHIDAKKVKGVILATGTRTDHTMIILKDYGLPVIYQADISKLNNGDMVIIDAVEGRLIVNPTEAVLAEYRRRKLEYEMMNGFLQTTDKVGETKTSDGEVVHLAGNADDLDEIERLVGEGASHGIGLLRSERLFMRKAGETRNMAPSLAETRKFFEEGAEILAKLRTTLNAHEHYQALSKSVAMEMVIRTIDLGEDKQLPYLGQIDGTALSAVTRARGLALCLKEGVLRDLYLMELKAMLQASGTYDIISCMFPMVDSREQFVKARDDLYARMEELRKAGIPFNEHIPIGAMIETPEAVGRREEITREASFINIGSNDLTQYTLGVSRYDAEPSVSALYDEFDPKVILNMKAIIDTGRQLGKPVCACGDVASNPMATFVLLGLDLDKFSMDAGSMKMVKHIIRNVPRKDCREMVGEILSITSAQQVRSFIKGHVLERFRDLWPGLSQPQVFGSMLERRLRLESGDLPD